MSRYDENGKFIESENSTKNLLLKKGIIVDTKRQRGYQYMLTKDGKDLGWFNAHEAEAKFLDNKA